MKISILITAVLPILGFIWWIYIKDKYENKDIWIYSGDIYENDMLDETKSKILSKCDVLVDGPFIFEKRDLKLPFKGSSNQRVIDLKHSTPNNVSILL